MSRLDRWAMQDGYLSHSWQAWCVFCRDILLSSAQGLATASNQTTGGPHQGRPEAELTWIGMRAAKGEPYAQVRSIRGMWLEPTWGDPLKFQQVAQAYQLPNEQAILTGILSAGQVAGHLQTIRNAAHHTNGENVAKVRALAVFYQASSIKTPGEAIFWGDPGSGDFLYRFWTARLIAAAHLAVN